MENSFTVEHVQYGIGTAILVKHRRKSPEDLFMCSFKGLKGSRTFYCRKHFDIGDEVWWSNGVPKKRTKVRSKADELEEVLKGFFVGSQPTNS
tara:strand:- start:31 stop:309 length:279 start_codon:yes stop_codon:yes gene_type:complete